MKKILTLVILGVTGLAGAAGAEANDGRRTHDYRPHTVEHRESHRPGRVWIAPRYESRIVRYECGRPVYGQVLVSAGHWSFEAECR
jgi:hypothetical protein